MAAAQLFELQQGNVILIGGGVIAVMDVNFFDKGDVCSANLRPLQPQGELDTECLGVWPERRHIYTHAHKQNQLLSIEVGIISLETRHTFMNNVKSSN